MILVMVTHVPRCRCSTQHAKGSGANKPPATTRDAGYAADLWQRDIVSEAAQPPVQPG